jgi:hypothetical protein
MIRAAIVLTTAILLAAHARAQAPATLESRVVSVGLFKNGLAVVKREVQLPGPGEYEVANVPEPVHGTFWIESSAAVTTRVTTREVESPETTATDDLQRALAGQRVVIHLRDSELSAVTGTVVDFPDEPAAPMWSRDYAAGAWRYGYGHAYADPRFAGASAPITANRRFLVVQTDAGRTLVDQSMIATLEVAGESRRSTRRQPVLVLSVGADANDANSKAPHTLQITYLCRGMSWMPAYHLDLGATSSLRLQQQAVIRNELEDLRDVELVLISGFPSVEFWNVTSPMAPSTTLASFFNQLSQQPSFRHGSRREVVSQQAVMSNYAGDAGDIDLSAIPSGDGVDLHYQAIGRHTLNAGDALMLTVAQGSAPFERIVEWIVPDLRDEHGRAVEDWQRQQDLEKFEDAPFDAVSFRNPLPFAMTTAPAMISSGGRFNGQQISRWVNAGEQTAIPITRALSVRAFRMEQEEQDQRELVNYGGVKFRKTPVKGELIVSNHRNEVVNMVIRTRFSGELIESVGEPTDALREEGVYSVNRRHELTWKIALQPGEQRTLTYRYEVMVRH